MTKCGPVGEILLGTLQKWGQILPSEAESELIHDDNNTSEWFQFLQNKLIY